MNADFNDDGRGRKRKGGGDREFERKRMPPKPTGRLADYFSFIVLIVSVFFYLFY